MPRPANRQHSVKNKIKRSIVVELVYQFLSKVAAINNQSRRRKNAVDIFRKTHNVRKRSRSRW